MKNRILFGLLLLIAGSIYSQKTDKNRMLGPFERFTNENPILEQDQQSDFKDPVRKRIVHWEPMLTSRTPVIYIMEMQFICKI